MVEVELANIGQSLRDCVQFGTDFGFWTFFSLFSLFVTFCFSVFGALGEEFDNSRHENLIELVELLGIVDTTCGNSTSCVCVCVGDSH